MTDNKTDNTTHNNANHKHADTGTDTGIEELFEENASQPKAEEQQGNAAQTQAEESMESLKARLAAAESKVRDEVLRAQAEIQNIHRRAERDVVNAHKYGQEKLIKELLAVVDSIERGLQTLDEQGGEMTAAVKTLRDGSELTLKMFLDTLAKFQVKQINPHGEPFNPQFHEAISMVPNPDVEPNSVIAVVQKGYTLSERLVRPAMVVVAKA